MPNGAVKVCIPFFISSLVPLSILTFHSLILNIHYTQIIDRKKNFFKLQQGEYIAAEKLELIYGQSPLVAQIFVYGDSFRSFLVAMIVAEESGVLAWAKEHKLEEKSFLTLCESEELKTAIKEDFARLMKENGLKGFERIVDFKVLADPWTVENDLLTPTFKLKRVCVKKAQGVWDCKM